MRNYSITRNKGEWYHAKVTDSYGNKYDNYFEHVWEKEEWFNSTNSQHLLAAAVANMARLDEEINLNKII